MRQSTEQPILEEPWIKRLRVTRSRSVKALEQLPSDHLPSPKPTIPSSTDNIPSLSSGADSKIYQKQKVTGSLRDRLVPVPEEPTHLAPVDTAAGAKSHSTKPSVAPFFRRIEAAFQDKPAIATKPRRAVASEMKPARSPSPDAEDLIQQLKEHYLQTATTLHESATMRLAQAHTDLCRQLRQTIVRSDAAFLASAEAHANKLAQPLAAVQIRSQRRGVRDGAALSWSEERSTGELVARAEEQLAQFERGVAGLWAEWAAAENEVRALLRGMVIPLASPLSREGYAGDGETGDGTVDDGEGEQLLRRLRDAIEREIECAEEDVFELGEESVALMKSIEKDFRKDTLADLHIFFQSIDEP